MTIHDLNSLPVEQLKEELLKCCGSKAWVNRMPEFFPMEDLVELLVTAEEEWFKCTEEDWKEAFSHHPQIGNLNSLPENDPAAAQWAAEEQSSMNTAAGDIKEALENLNRAYFDKFGFIFIVSATGKSPEEMLGLLQLRLSNTPDAEIKIAADEQNKITSLRLQKLLQ